MSNHTANLLPCLSKLTRAMLFACVASASLPAHAADVSSDSVVTHVGRWIAIQGNLALREIADDARQELDRRLAPLVPERKPTPVAQAPENSESIGG